MLWRVANGWKIPGKFLINVQELCMETLVLGILKLFANLKLQWELWEFLELMGNNDN